MTVEDHSQIHRLYCSKTGRDMPLTMSMHWAWNTWKAHHWTEADLELVIQHIKNLIKQDRRRPESFRFNNLIMNTDRFQEDLSEARAYARILPLTFKARVMEGRPKQERKENVRTPAEILAAAEAFRKFREYAKTL